MKNLFRKKRKFPTLAVILLVFGIVWTLSSLKVIPDINFPWLPVVVVIVALGMIVNRYN